jgi:ABC-type nitrate/sulfonate/bicarbonate transport system permease component
VLMRQEATAASNPVLGHVFVSIYYRAFGVGPGFFAGLANGVILGYLMYRSELGGRYFATAPGRDHLLANPQGAA